MEQRNLVEMGAIMENNNMLPLSTVLLSTTLVSFRKQTSYTPKEQVLHMHIYCSSLAIAGEENNCTDTSTYAIEGGAA